jgi:hypothetical protein
LKDKSQHSKLVGNYFIGTFEQRPGDPNYFDDGSPLYSQGGIQGDEPIGTLTSDTFIILGNKISFLIGGGCDYYLEYVELLVDGISVDKATGKCSERMDLTHFDVSAYYSRAAQIRIVDNSKANWGHINVDNFQFDWDVSGARHDNINEKVSINGKVETSLSGAVYAFHRVQNDGVTTCHDSIDDCKWIQEAKLNPSDKRQNLLFGTKIIVDDDLGISLITAPNSECFGFYKELQTVYPYVNSEGLSIASGLHYPLPMNLMRLFESYSTFAPQASGSGGVIKTLNQSNIFPNPIVSLECGAVYIFVKDPPVLSQTRQVISPQHWYPTETMKLQPGDVYALDHFGSSLAFSGNLLIVGTPGQDGMKVDGGAIYYFNFAFAAISFAAVS